MPLRVTLDDEADAAYIYTDNGVAAGGVAMTVELDYPSAMINVDFDSDGRVLGVEIIGAGSTLPIDLLACLRHSNHPTRWLSEKVADARLSWSAAAVAHRSWSGPATCRYLPQICAPR